MFWFVVFLTGADTSAKALFGNLQVVTAQRLGFLPVRDAATSSAGGVVGKMINLQAIAIAGAATGLSQDGQSKLFRFVIRHSVLLTVLTGGVAMPLAHVFRPVRFRLIRRGRYGYGFRKMPSLENKDPDSCLTVSSQRRLSKP